MFPNFNTQPPELITAKVFSEHDAGSLTDASQAWESLSDELFGALRRIRTNLLALTKVWTSPAADQMIVAFVAYSAWLQGIAIDAEMVSTKAQSVLAAFKDMVSELVGPQRIDDNRRRQAWLVNSNVLGCNTAEIASLETQYQGYWETNAQAMNRYAAKVLEALPAQPFAPPPPVIGKQRLANTSEALLSQQQG